MEHAYGWLSIIPPIIAIVLALRLKEVIGSLVIGIFSGYFIYVNFAPPEIAEGLASTNPIIGPVVAFVNSMIESAGDSWNMSILLFLALLGSLVAVITVAGGSRAYAEWATERIKTRRGAQLATFLLGCIIFIDDYFNSLTVGTVMRPVTDKHRVSRAKLAYILDSTAAPVTILVPVSSWVAYIISVMGPSLEESGFTMNGLTAFMSTVPFNLYAWMALLMVVLMAMSSWDFGPMAVLEEKAINTGELQEDKDVSPPGDDFSSLKVSEKGKPIDLILPIIGLVIFTVMAMLYTGGLFDGASIWEAFGDTDAGLSLVYGGVAAIILCLLMFLPRKLMTFSEFMNAFTQGIKSMVPAFAILILAWTFGAVLRDGGLQTGSFVAGLVEGSIPVALLPAIIFVVAGFISFATGTSWGTFAIMLPIAIPIAANTAPEMLGLFMAAVLAGAVYGDHSSPISDTTILSSTGAACYHLDHVATQLPYAGLCAVVSLVGFIVAGFTNNFAIALFISTALLLIVLRYIKYKKTGFKLGQSAKGI